MVFADFIKKSVAVKKPGQTVFIKPWHGGPCLQLCLPHCFVLFCFVFSSFVSTKTRMRGVESIAFCFWSWRSLICLLHEAVSILYPQDCYESSYRTATIWSASFFINVSNRHGKNWGFQKHTLRYSPVSPAAFWMSTI